MRNLKRALSLALASVMLLGMMVVGTSAASYPDVDSNDNVEAIEVLNAVKVMIGEQGNFNPDGPVNRHQMAVIMAKLVLGNEIADKYVGTHPFTDVAPWADKYVAACYENGIVAGTSKTTFGGDKPLTAVEAAAFMLRALGYKDLSKGASDWSVPVTAMANQIRLFSGVASNPKEELDRNQVAQLALNTLKSPVVDLKDGTFTATDGDGKLIISGGSREYIVRSSTENYAQAINDTETRGNSASGVGGYTIELGEHLYNGDLKLYDNRTDVFGRPARRWEYKGVAIGTYMKTELLKEEYTTKVTGKALYELLGKDVVDDYTFNIAIDGESAEEVLNSVTLAQKDQYFFNKTTLNRTNTNQVGGTGNGVLTQVFVDGGEKQVYISIMNTYLAKASADYNARRDEASFTIWNVQQVTVNGVKALVKDKTQNSPLMKAAGDDFDVDEIKADDIVLVRVAENEIQEIITPDVVDDATITAFKNGSYVVADQQYDYASTAKYDAETLNQYSNTNMKDKTYRIFLDKYGYLIGIEQITGEDHYAFLTGINSYTENLKDQTAIGNVVFLDGTSKNITINMKDSKNAQGKTFTAGTDTPVDVDIDGASGSNEARIWADTGVSSLMNTWCTYSVDSDNVYTLKEVANTAATFDLAGGKTAKLGQSHMGGTYTLSANPNNILHYSSSAQDASDTSSNNGPQKVAAATAAATQDLYYDVANGANNKYVVIDKGHVSLDGIPGSSFLRVYGNNDSVYLSAETDIITAKTALLAPKSGNRTDEPAVIITGASAVSTGVQNVNLNAWNAQAMVADKDAYHTGKGVGMLYSNVSDGVYTLFNDKGYVIAAMVVGEDDGSSTSFAWVSSGNMNREGLVDGNWEYSRDVIMDGKEATLTETESNGTTDPEISNAASVASFISGDESSSIWWAVRTKGDGTVKDVTRVKADGSNYYYISSIGSVDAKTDKTTVLEEGFTGSEGYTVKVTGNTLQVESKTGVKRGFAVKSDAGIAVVKDELIYRNGVPTGEYNYKNNIEYFTNGDNAEGLKQAVGLIQDKNFNGYIAAILKDGRAECVIIYDKAEADVDIGGEGVNVDAELLDNDDLYIPSDDGTVPNRVEQFRTLESAIKEKYKGQGIKSVNITSGGGSFTAATGLGDANKGSYSGTLTFENGDTLPISGNIRVGDAKLNAENIKAEAPDMTQYASLYKGAGASQQATMSGTTVNVTKGVAISALNDSNNVIAGLQGSALGMPAGITHVVSIHFKHPYLTDDDPSIKFMWYFEDGTPDVASPGVNTGNCEVAVIAGFKAATEVTYINVSWDGGASWQRITVNYADGATT